MSYDGYEDPTDEQLDRIRKWPIVDFFPHTPKHADYSDWFAFIKALWWMPDWGWREYEGKEDGESIRVFYISTGGWSGNEELISAMGDNYIGWSQTFKEHRSGGHYRFAFDRRGERQAAALPAPPSVPETPKEQD